jgi:ribonuclease E
VDQVDSDQEFSGSAAQASAEPRRQDPQVVAVPMDSSQELVFGWLGLNPALLADPAPEDLDNVVSRVVRPGDDADAVLEAAKQELASSGGRRRRRGGRGSGNGNGQAAPAAETSESIPVEITPLLEPEPTASEPALVEIAPLVVSTPQSEPAEAAVATEAEPTAAEPEAESEGEGRRRRRRRSAG